MKNKDLTNLIIFIVLFSLFIMLTIDSTKLKVSNVSTPLQTDKPSMIFKSSLVRTENTPLPEPVLPSLPFHGKPSPLSFPCEVNINELKNRLKYPVHQYVYQLLLGDMKNLDMVDPLLWCVYSPHYLANFKQYIKPLYDFYDSYKLDNLVKLSIEFLEYYTANGLTNPCQLKTLRVHMVEPITEYNHQLSFQLQQLL